MQSKILSTIESLGMTDAEICVQLGLSFWQLYHRRVTGRAKWQLKELVLLARLANIRPEDLLGEEASTAA